MMTQVLPYLSLGLLLVVAVILGLGLTNMMRGGSVNRSQNLMRLRVLAQFVAVIAIALTVYLMGRG
jgi:hypothetical protein